MPNFKRRLSASMWCTGGVLLSLAAAAPVHAAEALTSVLEHVHENHPRLQAARNNLLAEHERVPSALAAFLPTVSVSAELGRTSYEQERKRIVGVTTCRDPNIPPENCPQDQQVTSLVAGAEIQSESFYYDSSVAGTNPSYIQRAAIGRLNLFRSGADLAQYRSAHHLVDRQEGLYRSVEQEILLQAIQSYLEVRLARRTIGYRESNLEALRERQRVTQDQFDIQDKTLADLEQVRARVAVARSDLALARAAAAQAEATFLRVVGRMPGPALKGIPCGYTFQTTNHLTYLVFWYLLWMSFCASTS